MNPSQSIFPMNNQHKAKPEDWHYIQNWAVCRPIESSILELLNRVESLESTQHAHADLAKPPMYVINSVSGEVKPVQPNHPSETDSSLVQRVAAVIDNGAACDRAPERIARDSIREVAAWLISNPDHHAPPALVFASEQEAER